MESRDVDVVVVGAGFAGLVTARNLARGGASVAVLEARDRVGGRTLNIDVPGHPGKVVEIGGQWIGPTQDRLQALADDLRFETYLTYDIGDRIYEKSGKMQRFQGDLPPFQNPLVAAEMAGAVLRMDRLAARVNTDAPWETPGAERLDGETARSWMYRTIKTREGRGMFEIGVEAVFSVSSSDISALHLGFYLSSGGGLSRLEATTDGAQERRFVGGSQAIAIKLAEELGDRVVLEAPVRSIKHSGDGVVVSGESVRVAAQRVVVAVPPTLAGRIAYDPPLPALRDQLTQRIPAGTVIKCLAFYDEPFWRSEGLSGTAFSLDGPVKVTFDNSPQDGSPGILLGWVEGEAGRKLGAVDPATRRSTVIRCLERLYGPRAGRPEAYVDKDWSADEWTRGGYTGFMPTGVWTQYGRALREPIGRIHWAGTEMATRHSGYIDGAISSGEAAAASILEQLDHRVTVDA